MGEKMRILITGIAGLLGSRLADYLIENTEHELFGIDDLSGGYIDNIPKEVKFYKFDLSEDGKVMPSNKYQANALRIEADLQELSSG